MFFMGSFSFLHIGFQGFFAGPPFSVSVWTLPQLGPFPLHHSVLLYSQGGPLPTILKFFLPFHLSGLRPLPHSFISPFSFRTVMPTHVRSQFLCLIFSRFFSFPLCFLFPLATISSLPFSFSIFLPSTFEEWKAFLVPHSFPLEVTFPPSHPSESIFS